MPGQDTARAGDEEISDGIVDGDATLFAEIHDELAAWGIGGRPSSSRAGR